ncbi:diacylglycerol acyltransferase family protein [Mycobacterium ulcerans str. Harvey]|uniref:Diacylglycerol acyltransferase family protein n=1 Tax=Mycobacterium ulcerans str. Harvey TaxID=1299332 RepID=A0ABN0QPN3_MYCUL|nr:diacylglycerol acyltransferase family protein [Mycobacterium ulcerans str. Harvey]
MGSRLHLDGDRGGHSRHQAVVSVGGARFGVVPADRRRAGGVQPFRWGVNARLERAGPALYGKFGYQRPLYTLAHYGVFITPFRASLGRLGVIHASPDNATAALRSGGVVLVFPGGDYDAFRPTLAQNVIDFGGRTGYVRAAMRAGVPIVPAVSIGGQETQLFVSRGNWLAKRLGSNESG